MPAGIDPAAIWLVAALLLAIAEIVVPGVFLIFVAAAAAITAGISVAVPDLPVIAQLGSFGVWSVVAVIVGRRFATDVDDEGVDAGLNDRAARLIGQVVRVETAITGGEGRVRIGDGSWLVTGPDADPGTAVRIVAVDGGIVRVEPVEGRSG